MNGDDFSKFEDMIGDDDEGSMAMYGWRVLMFMDKSGTEWFKWQSFGDPPIGVSIGTMELVKHKMLNNHDVVDVIVQSTMLDDDLQALEDDGEPE